MVTANKDVDTIDSFIERFTDLQKQQRKAISGSIVYAYDDAKFVGVKMSGRMDNDKSVATPPSSSSAFNTTDESSSALSSVDTDAHSTPSSARMKREAPIDSMKDEERADSAPSTSSACKSMRIANNSESPSSTSTTKSMDIRCEHLNEAQPCTSSSQATTEEPSSSTQEKTNPVPPLQPYASNSSGEANDSTQSASNSIQSETEYNTDSAPSTPCTPISTSSAGSDNTDDSDTDDPPDSIRYDLRNHWCEWVEKSRCRFCKIQMPASRCEKCDVNLCCNIKKNCFTAFHLLPEL